jgi:hypothetical protein
MMKKKLDKLIDLYTDTFCEKQEVTNDGWIGDIKGGINCFADAFLSFEDIRRDLDNDVTPGKIFDWYWNYSDKINYKSYLMLYGKY